MVCVLNVNGGRELIYDVLRGCTTVCLMLEARGSESREVINRCFYI
jgi:hypothetical protein